MTTKVTRDVFDGNVRPIQTIDIDGGSIDGTPIGVSTPNVGIFTNLTASNLTITTSANFNGATVSAINAYYADIAERYMADKVYTPGTVVKLGGINEITATTHRNDKDVFGIISTNPSYTLNHSDDELMLPVVLIGRAPCYVTGPVRQGERLMVSNVGGTAEAVWPGKPSFARAIKEDLRTGVRLVEVAIITIK